MAISFIQSAFATVSFATTVSVAYSSNPTAGNFLCASVGSDGAFATPTFTDNNSNTWADAVLSDDGGGCKNKTGYAANCNAGATTVTGNKSSNGAMGLAIAEYSGIATVSPLDQTNTGGGFGTDISTSSVTTTQADELLVGVVTGVTNNATFTPDAPWNERQDTQALRPTEFCDRIVSSTGSYTFDSTMSTTDTWRAAISTYKAASAAAAPSRSIPRMRVPRMAMV